jgi:hypothetical protein
MNGLLNTSSLIRSNNLIFQAPLLIDGVTLIQELQGIEQRLLQFLDHRYS